MQAIPKIKIDPDIIMIINLYTMFHSNIYNDWEENEWKLLVHRQTFAHQQSNMPSPLFFEGGA